MEGISLKGTNFKDFKSELLKNNKVRKQYDALVPKYEFISMLIKRRNELSISQRELAKLIDMQQPAICRLERGESNVTIGTLQKVANALDMEILLKAKKHGAHGI